MARRDTLQPASLLGGVWPVFQTPFHEDESIDYDTLEREIRWLFERGADGVAMAMVSEVLRLSGEERRELAEAACRLGRKNFGRGRRRRRRPPVSPQQVRSVNRRRNIEGLLPRFGGDPAAGEAGLSGGGG